MVDIETLSTRPNAAILQIGACVLDHNGVIKKCFDVVIDSGFFPVDQFDFDQETIDWWKSHGKEVKDKVLNGKAQPEHALKEFGAHVLLCCPDRVWANSPAFDLIILEHAFRFYDVECPWAFYNCRDLRTLKDFCGRVDVERRGPKHDALADAVYQAELLREYLRELI